MICTKIFFFGFFKRLPLRGKLYLLQSCFGLKITTRSLVDEEKLKIEKKKRTLKSKMKNKRRNATTVGVEPTTFWSEVKRANPLRYAVSFVCYLLQFNKVILAFRRVHTYHNSQRQKPFLSLTSVFLIFGSIFSGLYLFTSFSGMLLKKRKKENHIINLYKLGNQIQFTSFFIFLMMISW